MLDNGRIWNRSTIGGKTGEMVAVEDRGGGGVDVRITCSYGGEGDENENGGK